MSDKRNSTTMKVLFLAEELRVGGAETYFYRLEHGINRDVIDFQTMAVPSGALDKLQHPEAFSAYTFSPVDRVRSIARKLTSQDFAVVHANSLRLCLCAFVARRIARSDTKLVYTRHNETILEKLSRRVYYWAVNHMADAIIAICKTEKESFIANGISERKVLLINNAVDTNRFSFSQRFAEADRILPRIGILARISPEKRHDLFLDIAVAYHALHPRAVFYIAGDGPDYEKVADKISDRGIGGYVHMLGRVDAARFLPAVDILLLVSDREVMPMSILEGMASGCGIIARSVGGIKDVVTSETGVLISGADPSDFADAIDR